MRTPVLVSIERSASSVLQCTHANKEVYLSDCAELIECVVMYVCILRGADCFTGAYKAWKYHVTHTCRCKLNSRWYRLSATCALILTMHALCVYSRLWQYEPARTGSTHHLGVAPKNHTGDSQCTDKHISPSFCHVCTHVYSRYLMYVQFFYYSASLW